MRAQNIVGFLLVAGTPVLGVSAQAAGAGQTGRRALLARGTEIALARSGAPASVSAAARVLVLTDSGFVEAAAGSNGVTCLVDRSWIQSLEPECFDAEASATVLAVETYRTFQFHLGRPKDQIDREVNERLGDGRFRLPRRPALVYMMSSAQRLISDEGQPAGKWYPHLMLYMPYLTNTELGLGEPPDMRGFGVNVSDSGKPWATLVVPVRTFVDPPPGTIAP